MGFEVAEATIASIHAAYRARELSPAELVRAYLDRIEAYDRGGPALAAADVVQEWNAHALAATNAQNPFLQARSIAIVQLAVFEAVNAVVGDYEPYVGTVSAPAGASVNAAAIEAAYRALLGLGVAGSLGTVYTAALAAIPDGKKVYLVGRGVPPKENGSVKVMVMVALMQYGSQWRAAIPSEIEAQLDDLLEGRTSGAAAAPASAVASTSPASSQPLAPGISELLVKAETALVENRCTDYYDQYMSPNFNKATSRSARKTLINACTNDESTRETMITTLRIVQELKPRYDGGGTRAIYDVSGQGLPYERFVLERGNDMRWYIAE